MIEIHGSVVYNNKKYTFKEPLLIISDTDGEYTTLESEVLEIFSCGNSFADTFNDFWGDFEYICDRYVELSDDKLGRGPLTAKKWILKNVTIEDI